jgi:hypothetical protein
MNNYETLLIKRLFDLVKQFDPKSDVMEFFASFDKEVKDEKVADILKNIYQPQFKDQQGILSCLNWIKNIPDEQKNKKIFFVAKMPNRNIVLWLDYRAPKACFLLSDTDIVRHQSMSFDVFNMWPTGPYKN